MEASPALVPAALLCVLAWGQASAQELPTVAGLADEARARAAAAAAPSLSAGDEVKARRVVDALQEIRMIPTATLDCNGLPMCPSIIMYYDQASVDLNTAKALRLAPDLIRAGHWDQAANLIQSILASTLYAGDKLAPARVPLYPREDVVKKVTAAFALACAP